jgi:hypothetical protein
LRQFAVSAPLWDFVSHRAVTPKKLAKTAVKLLMRQLVRRLLYYDSVKIHKKAVRRIYIRSRKMQFFEIVLAVFALMWGVASSVRADSIPDRNILNLMAIGIEL